MKLTKKYSFEKLEVWQLSRKLVKITYGLTNTFPVEEKFGIINQMRRAAISVSSNISEGSSRSSFKDQARFTVISYGSLIPIYP
jgi:four helix bundle protein